MNEPDGWASPRAVRRYVNIQAEMVPGRDEVLSLVGELVAAGGAPRPEVLDLGGGFGEVTAAVLRHAPAAAVTLVDFSDEMLRRCRQRFADDSRVRLVKHDLSQGLPAGCGPGRFDAVVSCFALHHLPPESQVLLYGQIRSALRPAGRFVNGDRVEGESPAIAAWELDRWVTWMVGRAKEKFGLTRTAAEVRERQLQFDEELGRTPGSLWTMQDELRRAGFASVDCVYKNHTTAVVVALPTTAGEARADR